MRHYELMIVLDPGMGEDGFNKHLERVKKSLESGGGKIVRDDRWGLRTLAYEIKKQAQGYYTVIEWEGPAELIAEFDRSLRLDENVLRHLIVHLDPVALEAQEELQRSKAGGPGQEEKRGLDLDKDKDKVEAEEVAVPDAGEEVEAEEVAVPDAEEEVEAEEVEVPDAGEEVKAEEVEVPDAGDEVEAEEVAVPDTGEEVEAEEVAVPDAGDEEAAEEEAK